MRYSRWRRSGPLGWELIGRLALVALVALPVLAQYEPKLEYQEQERTDRWFEGLKEKPVGALDVELLSARIVDREKSREKSREWPEEMRLLFYLPPADKTVRQPEKVFITVRQPRPGTVYYWLDNVRPASPWKAGGFQRFAWPTATVLQQVPSLRVGQLGAVVRLEEESAGLKEVVAPTLLYHSRVPPVVEGYRFTLRTSATAFVTGEIYRRDTKVGQRPQNKELAGSPFTVEWPSAGQPEGWYRLVLSGWFDLSRLPLDKEILFYHQAQLPAEGGQGPP